MKPFVPTKVGEAVLVESSRSYTMLYGATKREVYFEFGTVAKVNREGRILRVTVGGITFQPLGSTYVASGMGRELVEALDGQEFATIADARSAALAIRAVPA